MSKDIFRVLLKQWILAKFLCGRVYFWAIFYAIGCEGESECLFPEDLRSRERADLVFFAQFGSLWIGYRVWKDLPHITVTSFVNSLLG